MILKLTDIVKRLKLHKPNNEKDILILCRFPLEFISDGAFRNVYRIVGTEYVLKVPIQPHPFEVGMPYIEHARYEYKAWQCLKRLKKFEPIRHLLPEFHYFDVRTGITLATYYKKLPTVKQPYLKIMEEAHNFLVRHGYEDPDLYSNETDYGHKVDNYGLDKEGKLKIIDFGCVC